MSEPVLKAIIQLLAISATVDGTVTDSERKVTYEFIDEQLNKDDAVQFVKLFDEYTEIALKTKLQTINISKKINQELNQKQKIIVVIHLLELINSDGSIGEAEEFFVDYLAKDFNIHEEEYQIIKNFVTNHKIQDLSADGILLISGQKPEGISNVVFAPEMTSHIAILRIPSLEMYMLKFFKGEDNTFLNGVNLKDKHIYSFSNGSAIRGEKISPIYYSDIVSHFLREKQTTKISFEAQHLYHAFPGGKIGLRDINLGEESGKLIGIMGASGSGKSTLLNVLNGNMAPVGGRVLINNINIHDVEEKKLVEGVIGYVPQDDLLIEELTVHQNLYYAAKLCFKNYNEQEINRLVDKTLLNLGLSETKDLRVGNVLQKTISGGQRKRLNIGLELLREPSVLFVDEPTSGLSSNDSENILDLLKELSLKGKLIFVVIHQPSSEIYKMFDKMLILDTGGYQIFYGNPIEAITYFRIQADLINAEQGVCDTCGNVNPEQIFNIIETKLVDEYGRYTNQRKVLPVQWRKVYEENNEVPTIKPVTEKPDVTLHIPNRWMQFCLFAQRDLMAKLSNSQYMMISLLVSPILSLILAYIVRYYELDQDQEAALQNVGYVFSENMNIPAYIFMSIIVALFVGLIISAEEIIKDAKILKREAFLHLSRGSYLASKIIILFSFSAFQTLTFVWIGNTILGIEGMHFEYWLVLFSTSCFANMLGLNISATFNSAITIYILIPILLIPQLILGGIVVKFDEINPQLASENKVPVVSEIMVARWAFEAITVSQFKSNAYEEEFYEYDKEMAKAEYKKVYYIPKLKSKIDYCLNHLNSGDEKQQQIVKKDLDLLNYEINKELILNPDIEFKYVDDLSFGRFGAKIGDKTQEYIEELRKFYVKKFNAANDAKDKIVAKYVKTAEDKQAYLAKIQLYHNKSIQKLVENSDDANRIDEINGKLIQKIYPVYHRPEKELVEFFEFRTHFFAPEKHLFGYFFDTLYFNVLTIMAMTFLLYISLYFYFFRAILSVFGAVFSKRRKSGRR